MLGYGKEIPYPPKCKPPPGLFSERGKGLIFGGGGLEFRRATARAELTELEVERDGRSPCWSALYERALRRQQNDRYEHAAACESRTTASDVRAQVGVRY